MPGLKFRGLMLYSGNIWGSEAERQRSSAQVSEKLGRVLQVFAEARMPVEIVSGVLHREHFSPIKYVD
jgi:hypothetical protein